MNVTRLILAALYLGAVVLLARLEVRLSLKQITFLGLSGIVGFTLGDSALFKAFQLIGARITMLIMSLAPAFASLLAYLLMHEGLSALGMWGIALTMVGICVVVLDQSNSTGTGRIAHLSSAGLLLAFLASVGQGSGLVLAKMAFREGDVNGFVATLVRILASLGILFPVAAISGAYRSPIKSYLKDKRAFLLTAVGSVFGPFLGVAGSLISIQHTSVGIAATLMATTPLVMLPLVHFIHRERIGPRAIAGSFVAVAGVAVLFLR